MKHFNKSFEVNLNVIEQNNPNHNNSFGEGLPILILIGLGCVGLFVYSNIISPKKPNFFHSGITSNSIFSDSNQSQERHSSLPKVVSEKQLSITGQQEAGEALTFTIDGFDKEVIYNIDFGDGHQQSITEEKVQYTYKRSGDYEVALTINYKNEPEVKILKKIYIEELKGVTTGAFQKR